VGMADIHMRSPEQVLWDEKHREAMLLFPHKSAREVKRWMIRHNGKRPTNGWGLNG
jgi:hypothetical protein